MGRGARATTVATATAAASNDQIREALRARGGQQPGWVDDPHAMNRRIEQQRRADRTNARQGSQEWLNSAGVPHRDSDLPAVIVAAGGSGSAPALARSRRAGGAKNGTGSSLGPVIQPWMGGGSIWARDGVAHRDIGAAMEAADGSFEHWDQGQLHRVDGPAVQRTDKHGRVSREWWIRGKRHREDGPAVERHDGTREYYRHGVCHRDGDLPAVEHASGRTDYWVDGRRHRDGDKPARVFANGKREWWTRGKRHRAEGPAVIGADGSESFYWHGKPVTAEAHARFRELARMNPAGAR